MAEKIPAKQSPYRTAETPRPASNASNPGYSSAGVHKKYTHGRAVSISCFSRFPMHPAFSGPGVESCAQLFGCSVAIVVHET